jgi:DNA polymerase I-like protein with 3'-5' exonuclease and polymerase domains
LAVGLDGRNRTLLSGFRATSGRSAPSNTKFVFGPATRIRSLIRPAKGRAIAYCDYGTQEVAIAAVLSGDAVLWADYLTGDIYLAFAKRIGFVPADATKVTHGDQREICKQLFLGISYGMSDRGFADRTGLHIEQARAILRQHRARYSVFHHWVQGVVNQALLGVPLVTVFGWRLWWRPGVEALREDYMAHSRRGEHSEKE